MEVLPHDFTMEDMYEAWSSMIRWLDLWLFHRLKQDRPSMTKDVQSIRVRHDIAE